MNKKLEPPPVVGYEAVSWHRIRRGNFFWTGSEWMDVPSHACLFWLPDYAKAAAARIPKRARFAACYRDIPEDDPGPVVIDEVRVEMRDTVVTTAVDVSRGGAPKTKVRAKLVVENFAYMTPGGRRIVLDRPKAKGGAK